MRDETVLTTNSKNVFNFFFYFQNRINYCLFQYLAIHHVPFSPEGKKNEGETLKDDLKI